MSAFSNLQTFLIAHQCPKGQKATHTRIGDKDLNIYGGSYLIPSADLPEFYRLYSDHVFKQGKKEYLTERQLDKNGQMMVDLDFRYNYNVEKRIHTKELVDTIVEGYMETMKEVFVFDKDTSVSVFVMEKPNVNRLADGSLTKDGIHIAFGLRVDYDKQLYIRQKMMAKDLLKDLPLINDANSVFDEGISTGKTQWQLFGSRKPANEAYAIKYQYEITYDQSDGEFMFKEPKIAFDPLTHFQYLSARFDEYHEYPVNPKWSGSPSAPAKKNMMRIPSISDSEDDKCSKDYNKNDKYYKLLFEFLGNGFNEQGGKMIDWDQWVRVCSVLHANKYPRDMWLDWCALSSCSVKVKSDAESLWDNFEKRPERQNGMRTLDTIAKKYKPKEYANWRLKYEVSAICDNESNEAIKMLLSVFNPKAPTRVCFTDSVFGQLFKALYGDKFVYCCDTIYHFNEIYWEADNKKHTNIQHFINTTFISDLKRWIRGKITYYASKNSEDTETDENSNDDKYLVFWTKLNLYVTEYLQTQKATEQLIKMVCSKICNDSQKWDLNPYMFVFKNCVFDLKEGKATTPNPADFMTTCCGWEYDFNYKCDDKLVKLVTSIQPIQDVRDYLLQAYSTGMVGIQNRNVFIFTGTGGNGKSVLDELLFAMLGGYSYTLPKAFLTQPFKEGANPEVINLHNKRAVLVSEPDANKNIVCSSLKAMSGDSKISSRRLYGDIETINITATNFIECNTAPDLDEMNDAMTDRLGEGVINFNSKFVKKSVWDSATDEERSAWAGIQDLYYKSDDFKTAYRQCFFELLIPFVMKTIKVPSSVVVSSSRYLTKSDPIYPFLLEHYEKSDGSIIKVKEFHSKLVQQNGYSWTKQQKERFVSIRKFEDEVKKNVFMRKLIKDRDDRYGTIKLNSLSICGWKEKEEEEQIEE